MAIPNILKGQLSFYKGALAEYRVRDKVEALLQKDMGLAEHIARPGIFILYATEGFTDSQVKALAEHQVLISEARKLKM